MLAFGEKGELKEGSSKEKVLWFCWFKL